MKIAPRDAEQFVAKGDIELAAVLIYGPDQGLVRERVQQLADAVTGGDDPFAKTELSEKDILDDGSLLAAERGGMVFGGARRVIVVSGAGDRCAGALEAACDAPGDGLIIIEAGELPPRSKLRKFCETAKHAGALACYADDQKTLRGVIEKNLADHGLGIARDALDHFAANLGNDRMVTRSEIDKLITFVGCREDRRVVLEDVMACLAENEPVGFSDVLESIASGNSAALITAFQKSLEDGISAVALLRMLQRFFQRLHVASLPVGAGTSPSRVVDDLRPPVFFREKPIYIKALSKYRTDDIGQVLGLLTAAEKATKSGRGPEDDICERALLQTARLGRGR